MKSEFSRVITLLRKEKNISQKHAAAELGISQALLSHYENGIRECGLGFLVKCADFYGVSCDYLLGRSADRDGTTLSVDEIPEPDMGGKENVMGSAGILPVLNKKLIANSLNILFDQMARTGNRRLITAVSEFLMLSVYRMFRLVYSANPKNQQNLFSLPRVLSDRYADAVMQLREADIAALVESGDLDQGAEPLTTQRMSELYPLFATSLLSLVKNAESAVTGSVPGDR